MSSVSLSEDVAGWQLVATEWGDDMGRRWTQLHWLPSGKTVNVFCVDTDWNGKTGPTHMYVKWNAWKFSGKSFSRSMSFVWGTDGQRKINDAILYLYRVIGLVRAQG